LTKQVILTVNGIKRELIINVGDSLLNVLRNQLNLTGAKEGCGVGECGVCTVLVDGENIDSCIYLAVWADGREIRTIEGINAGGELSPMQEAFIETGAVQCGFCTPGLIMSSTAAMEINRKMSREEIRHALSGNLCRCTGYQKVVDAVDKVINNKQVL
jgi:carbon-monoxide dehydrogenase small subunit